MSAGYASWLSLALAFAGMAALACAMERHHAQYTGLRELPAMRAWQLRCTGVPLLIAAALPCVWTWGATVGAVAWLGFLSADALACVAVLGAVPRWLPRLAWVCGAVAVPALAWAGVA